MVEKETSKAGPGRVGAAVRAHRERLGLSLQELADRVGCAKSYLSAVETGRRPCPGDEILTRIEEAMMLDAGSLADAGRWERSLRAGGPRLAGELLQMQRQQSLTRELVQMVSGTGLDEAYRRGDLRRMVERLSQHVSPDDESPIPIPLPMEVPLINRVAAGYPREFTDLSYPARVADEYLRCPDLRDPDAFAARVVGDSMEPAYVEGDIVVFSPAKAVRSGMDCFARLEPDHETTFKRVYFEESASNEILIRLQPLNSRYPPRVVSREHVAGLYAAVSVMRQVP